MDAVPAKAAVSAGEGLDGTGLVAPSQEIRLAIEGCGHGTLHAIYASVEHSCRVKGWPGVDLLIIGGDFQAVRNQYDLNVTSMPERYRRMADFHEYYSGARVAPYLTIFIGGNHEASNHLFELYYGGWVAANIYYLGAANVIRFGPLKIAGLSGIWKGYDYRKPHFERLPYNRDEMASIYHVRELDVRKLLSFRSQVDIGLSHDWPQGVEMHGDHQWLFRTKKGFGVDSRSGKLGSVAARQCLERLRPPYWFSAHLHTKFAAIVHHDSQTEARVTRSSSFAPAGPGPAPVELPKVSAWQQFSVAAQHTESAERSQVWPPRENEPGARSSPQYQIRETFTKVGPESNLTRNVLSTTNGPQVTTEEDGNAISNLDGCSFSRPTKRQRLDLAPQGEPSRHPVATETEPVTKGAEAVPMGVLPPVASLSNPDAIDIDFSDGDDEPGATTAGVTRATKDEESGPGLPDSGMLIAKIHDSKEVTPRPASVSSERDVVTILPLAASPMSTPLAEAPKDEPTLPPAMEEAASNVNAPANTSETERGKRPEVQDRPSRDDVSEDLRAELAALSSNFAPPEKVEVAPALPFPEAINNKTTQFLALGKCEPYQEFLQLLSVVSASYPGEEVVRPLKLSYDPEWLAIQRAFASDLTLGGEPTAKVPPHRGDTFYYAQIVNEREWIDERVVKPGKLLVPENFSITAPVYDPGHHVDPTEMPREVTNPQTSAFCELIGIQNRFHITEAERDRRIQQGPRTANETFNVNQHRPRGRGNAPGGRGGFGDGRGQGRGRGRGRGGRW